MSLTKNNQIGNMNRRHFLKTTAGVGAGLTASSALTSLSPLTRKAVAAEAISLSAEVPQLDSAGVRKAQPE